MSIYEEVWSASILKAMVIRKRKDGRWNIDFSRENSITPLLNKITYPDHIKNFSFAIVSTLYRIIIGNLMNSLNSLNFGLKLQACNHVGFLDGVS